MSGRSLVASTFDRKSARMPLSLERFLVLAGNDLCDLMNRMFFVARIDSLGAVAKLEINAGLET
jgi:hypothetical protein